MPSRDSPSRALITSQGYPLHHLLQSGWDTLGQADSSPPGLGARTGGSWGRHGAHLHAADSLTWAHSGRWVSACGVDARCLRDPHAHSAGSQALHPEADPTAGAQTDRPEGEPLVLPPQPPDPRAALTSHVGQPRAHLKGSLHAPRIIFCIPANARQDVMSLPKIAVDRPSARQRRRRHAQPHRTGLGAPRSQASLGTGCSESVWAGRTGASGRRSPRSRVVADPLPRWPAAETRGHRATFGETKTLPAPGGAC